MRQGDAFLHLEGKRIRIISKHPLAALPEENVQRVGVMRPSCQLVGYVLWRGFIGGTNRLVQIEENLLRIQDKLPEVVHVWPPFWNCFVCVQFTGLRMNQWVEWNGIKEEFL